MEQYQNSFKKKTFVANILGSNLEMTGLYTLATTTLFVMRLKAFTNYLSQRIGKILQLIIIIRLCAIDDDDGVIIY